MTPTTTLLTKKFNEFNKTYFNGSLPMVKFGYMRRMRCLGNYSRTKNVISITLAHPNMTEHDIEEILIHEMVHVWQNFMGISYWRDGHRGCFRTKANEINRKSKGYFHISRCTNLECGDTYVVKRDTSYVTLLICSNPNDSKLYIGRVDDPTVFEGWLGTYYKNIKCYVGSGSGLGNFTKSFKRFNYKTMTKEKFENTIKPCLKKEIPFNNLVVNA